MQLAPNCHRRPAGVWEHMQVWETGGSLRETGGGVKAEMTRNGRSAEWDRSRTGV